MRKLIRYSAAVLLSLSVASTGMITAYADETVDYSNVGPGFANGAAPSEPSSGTVIIRTETPDASADGSAQTPPAGSDASQPGTSGPSGPVTGETQAPAGGETQAPAGSGTQGPGSGETQAPADGGTQTPAPELSGNTVFNSDEEANGRAYQRTQQYGTSVTHIAASALRNDGYWTPSFVGDDMLHNQGNGWYSMQMVLRNTMGNILYRTYSSTTGWSRWAMNSEETTHLTDGSVIEAVQVRLSGIVSQDYDVYYHATLSDGTVLDWAKNGQTAGAMANGKWLVGFRMTLSPKNSQFPYATAKTVDAPAGTDGVQLTGGLPTYTDGSGNPYTGWGWVGNQRYYFVDNQAVTGWQYIDGYKYFFDDNGMMVSDLRNILGDARPYMLKINRVTDTLTVYAQDGGNGFIIPVVSFLTTTGDDTPEGTFKVPAKYRWRLMIGDVYTQYAMRLKDGFMIHSVIFNEQNEYSLDASTYNNLGLGRSHGCTRLKTGEMKWIYDNCPVGTTVIIYDDIVNGPFEAPVLEDTIPADQNFDPTDPSIPEEVRAAARVQAEAQAAANAQQQAAAMVPMPSEPIN